MQQSNNPIEAWLKKLQEESWNLELLISGFSIFLLIQSNSLLASANEYIFIHFTFRSWAATIIILILILQLAVWLLTINLVIHIILRGFWIGAIGLRSVQAEIDYPKLKFSEFFTKKLQSRITSLDATLARLDRVCSVIFSFTFLIVCMVLSLFLTFILFSGIVYLVNLVGEIEDSLIATGLEYVLTGLLFFTLIGSIIYLIDTLSLGFFKRYNWLSKLYYPIYWFFGIITMAGFYRAIYYHLVSHFPKRQIQLFLLAYVVLPVIIPFHKIDYYFFIPDQETPEKLVKSVYDDQRDEKGWISKASIPSQIITTSFLPLFIRYDVGNNDDILRLCDDYTPAKTSGFVSGIHISSDGFGFSDPMVKESDPTKLKNCLARFYELSIDDSLYTQQDYFYYTHPHRGEKGLYTMIDIQDLTRGMHNIRIQTKIFDDKDKLVKEDYISFPFWTE